MATKPVVTIVVPSPVELAPGGSAEARIGLTVAVGYHVQANPTNQQFLIPLKLEVEAVNGIRPGAPVYPPGRPFRLEGAGDDLPTYGGTFEVVVPLKAEVSAAVGEHVLRAALRYQGCDKTSCLFPAVERFTLTARVMGPGLCGGAVDSALGPSQASTGAKLSSASSEPYKEGEGLLELPAG